MTRARFHRRRGRRDTARAAAERLPGLGRARVAHAGRRQGEGDAGGGRSRDGFTLRAGYPNDNVYGVDLNFMMQKLQQDLARVDVTLDLQPLPYAVWREQLGTPGIPLTAMYHAPDDYGSGQYVAYFGMMTDSPGVKRAAAERKDLVVNPKEAELYGKALAASGEENVALYNELALEMMNAMLRFIGRRLFVTPLLLLVGVNAHRGLRLPADLRERQVAARAVAARRR